MTDEYDQLSASVKKDADAKRVTDPNLPKRIIAPRPSVDPHSAAMKEK